MSNNKKVAHPAMLFGIGLSAGVITTVFPRLVTFLSVSSTGGEIDILGTGYIIATLGIALIIGVSMIWLYMGTTESSKQLFMAALAIPAMLSGGINMANSVSVGNNEIRKKESTITNLQEKIQETANIGTGPDLDIGSFNFDKLSLPEEPEPTGFHFSIIPAAYAQEQQYQQSTAQTTLNPSVRFNSEQDLKMYAIIIASDEDSSVIDSIKTYQSDSSQISNLRRIKGGPTYHLILGDLYTKTDALLESVKLQKKGLSPSISKVK